MDIKYERVTRLIEKGHNRKELREQLSITEYMYTKLMKEDPQFRDAVNLGDELFNEKLERSLYDVALGHSKEETEIVVEIDELGREKTKHRTSNKYYKPDVTALKFALTNRKPDKWKDKIEHDIDTTTKVQIIHDIPPVSKE